MIYLGTKIGKFSIVLLLGVSLQDWNGKMGAAPPPSHFPHAYTFLTCHLLRRKNPHTKERKKRRFPPKKQRSADIAQKPPQRKGEASPPPQGRDRQTFCCGAVYFRWNYAKSACVRVKKKEGKPMTRGFFVLRRSFTSCFSLPRRDFKWEIYSCCDLWKMRFRLEHVFPEKYDFFIEWISSSSYLRQDYHILHFVNKNKSFKEHTSEFIHFSLIDAAVNIIF